MHAFNKNFPFENTTWLESKMPADEKLSEPVDNFLVKVDEDFKQTAENTPNLEQVAGNFIVFNHAYASWSQTVPVLQRVLTEQSYRCCKKGRLQNFLVQQSRALWRV